ncbi:hypothetical protein EBB07_23810 [Paenibacillaceae bacterium]|nr:hypothetical protein EBB07_23810 [Paenibacillaceae bacterium]
MGMPPGVGTGVLSHTNALWRLPIIQIRFINVPQTLSTLKSTNCAHTQRRVAGMLENEGVAF